MRNLVGTIVIQYNTDVYAVPLFDLCVAIISVGRDLYDVQNNLIGFRVPQFSTSKKK